MCILTYTERERESNAPEKLQIDIPSHLDSIVPYSTYKKTNMQRNRGSATSKSHWRESTIAPIPRQRRTAWLILGIPLAHRDLEWFTGFQSKEIDSLDFYNFDKAVQFIPILHAIWFLKPPSLKLLNYPKGARLLCQGRLPAFCPRSVHLCPDLEVSLMFDVCLQKCPTSSQPRKLFKASTSPPQRSWTWPGEPRSIGSLGPLEPLEPLEPLGFEVHQVHLLQIQHNVPTLHAPAHLSWKRWEDRLWCSRIQGEIAAEPTYLVWIWLPTWLGGHLLLKCATFTIVLRSRLQT